MDCGGGALVAVCVSQPLMLRRMGCTAHIRWRSEFSSSASSGAMVPGAAAPRDLWDSVMDCQLVRSDLQCTRARLGLIAQCTSNAGDARPHSCSQCYTWCCTDS